MKIRTDRDAALERIEGRLIAIHKAQAEMASGLSKVAKSLAEMIVAVRSLTDLLASAAEESLRSQEKTP